MFLNCVTGMYLKQQEDLRCTEELSKEFCKKNLQNKSIIMSNDSIENLIKSVDKLEHKPPIGGSLKEFIC